MKQYLINKDYTYLMIPSKILRNSELGVMEKLILSVMISYWNNYENIQVSIEKLSYALGCNKSTITRNISKLVERSLIKVIPIVENGIKKCNKYEINFKYFNEYFDINYFILADLKEEGVESKKGFSTSSNNQQNQPKRDFSQKRHGESLEDYYKRIGVNK